MRYDPIDSGLFMRNRTRLAELMEPNSVAIVHSNDVMPTNADGTLPFKQNSDVFYLSGIDQEETVLLFRPDAPIEKDRVILFVRETSELLAIWEGAKLTMEQATAVSGIQVVRWTDRFEAALHSVMPQVENVYLVTNEHLRAETVVETRNARFIKRCQAMYPLHTYKRLAPLMHKLRMIKDPVEIEQLQKAIDITEAGFRRVLDYMKPGVGEWEVEAEYLHEFIKNRSRGFAYTPIIGSGANANVLHYVENSNICKDGDLVLMDVGAEWANWNADMTRTIPVNGTFTSRQKEVYAAVLRVMKAANELLRPGMLPLDYQSAVLAIMTTELIGLGLITQEEADAQGESFSATKKYFMHGTSHHLGLDVHDVSPANEPFQVGMVFTIEPGIYIREEDIGIRLENNVVIEEKENRDLFANFPIEIDDIEQLMQG